MSGPKHASIHNPMADASRARTLFNSQIQRAREVRVGSSDFRAAREAVNTATSVLNDFADDERGVTAGFARLLTQANELSADIPSAPPTGAAAAMIAQAEDTSRQAQSAFDRGQGSNAEALFNRAASEAASAKSLAERESAAVAKARAEANAVAKKANALTRAAREAQKGARAQLQAEAEAARAEAAQAYASSVIERIGGLRHEKFAPSRLHEIQTQKNQADRQLTSGKVTAATDIFLKLAEQGEQIAAFVEDAEATWQREKEEAEHALAELRSLVSHVDRDALNNWSSDLEAGSKAEAEIAEIHRAIGSEQFREASARAASARASFDSAIESMNRNEAEAETTRGYMQTVMEVLHASGTNIAYELPTRDTPGIVRAHGAAENSEMEFVFNPGGDIPFVHNGEDGSCRAAVDALVARLEADGGEWQMNSWGNYAAKSHVAEMPTEKTAVKAFVRELG